MEREKFLRHGHALGWWRRGSLKSIEPEPIKYFRDDPVYLKPTPGEWVDPLQECKKEPNPLENGVFVWTEVKGTGHAFISVHEGNNEAVFTYGRFGRRASAAGAVGDGILNFLQFEDARTYYREELYKSEAKVFLVTDADPKIAKMYFEKLWGSGSKVKQTIKMGESTKKNGRTVDQYDVTGVNCTTHTTKGVKIAGSKIFEGGYTTNSQIRIDYEEDFAVPVSLQRYLEQKSGEQLMLVVDVTNEFKKQYPNTGGYVPTNEDTTLRVVTEVVSGIGKISPYSGGSVGGFLDEAYDVNK